MVLSQAQLKISLSPQLKKLLINKASRLGIPMTQFVKYLIIREVEQEEYPILSADALKRYDIVADEIRKGIGVHAAKDVDELFKQLEE